MKRLSVLVFLILLCSACSPDTGEYPLQTQAINLATLKGLTVPLLYPSFQQDTLVNCPVHEFNFPGQGWRASGTTGGLGYRPLTTFSSAGAAGAGLTGSLLNQAQLDSEVGILVVDDFKRNVFELGSALFTQTTLDEVTFKRLEQQNVISHGALVARHLNDTIKGTGRYTPDLTFPPASQTGIWIYREISTKKRLIVMAVNTHSPTLPPGSTPSKIIADNTRTTLQTLRQTYGINLAVINNSYVFMPCSVHQDFLAWDAQTPGTQTFQEYMAKVAGLNNLSNVSDLTNTIIESTNVASDPLLQLTRDPLYGAGRHVYVAASGNYGLGRAMYPANWDNVVSVSGSVVDNPATPAVNESRVRDPGLFNRGEIMHLGASFALHPPTGLPALPKPKPVYYGGTSYATPIVSAFSALDLAGKKTCSQGQGVSRLALNSLKLTDRHLEDWVVNNVVQAQGAVSLLCP